MFEPTTTLTAVKTKTVTRTQMAIALAFLGVSAIAAAAMGVAAYPAPVCTEYGVLPVEMALGKPSMVSVCKSKTLAPKPDFDQFVIQSYSSETLRIKLKKNNKQYTFKVGEYYKPFGKMTGSVLDYQQQIYLLYGGQVGNKADISLFWGYPAGGDGVFCTDTDESQKNFDGTAVKDFKFVNPYAKGIASYYDEELDEMVPVEDSCLSYDYGYYGAEAAAIVNNLQEGYCSTADGGKWFSKVIPCEGECVDGACVPVTAPVATSTIDCVDIVEGGEAIKVSDKSSSKVWWLFDSIRHEIPDSKTFKWYFHKEDGSANYSIIKKIPPTTLYQYTKGEPVCAKVEEPVTPTSTTPIATSTLTGLLPMYYPIFFYNNLGIQLINGVENDIFSFSVMGTNNGGVALKQLKFTMDVVDNVGTNNPGIKLTDFKLYRGDTNITSYVEFKKVGTLNGEFSMTTGTGMPFYIVWKSDSEEVVAGGMKNTYTIKAVCSGFTVDEDNDFVRVRLDKDDVVELDASKNINYLAPVGIGGSKNLIGLSDSTGGNIVSAGATLLWSDRSAPDHSAAVGSPPVSSGDWFNGYYAKNLPTQYSILIR